MLLVGGVNISHKGYRKYNVIDLQLNIIILVLKKFSYFKPLRISFYFVNLNISNYKLLTWTDILSLYIYTS